MKVNMQKEKNENKYIDTFTIYDKNFNYEDENAEAVVYLINPSGKNNKPNMQLNFVLVKKQKALTGLCVLLLTKEIGVTN